MNKIVLLSSAAVVAGFVAMPAAAQEITRPTVPLSDTNCNFPSALFLPGGLFTPACTTTGTRTATPGPMTVDPFAPTASRVTGNVAVTYSGDLIVDGFPVTFPAQAPFQFDASTLIDNFSQTVNVTSSYTGVYANTVLPNSILPDVLAGRAAYFPDYVNMSTTVNSITVDADGTATDVATGRNYAYTLSAPAPTTIIGGNSVALTGGFNSSDNGVIQMGTITGSAILKSGRATTPSSFPFDANGNPTGGWSSPYQLEYNITAAEIKTQLDVNGLITPTVSVTNGVNMNGSTITNLAAGVNPTDAVNKAQLDAVVAGTAFQGGSPNSLQIGTGSTAGGGAAVAIGLGQTATGNGAVAIGDPNTATGTGAVAIGADNTATGNGAVAIGNLTVANGAGNVALGNGAQATAANSVALGGASVADQANTVSIGAAGAERRITNVAAGTGATDAANFGQVTTVANAAAAAQTTANTAQTVATAAQTTANTAQTTAVAAQGVASNAQAAAVAAQAVATSAQTSANTALTQNATQDSRLNAMDVLNTTQNSRLAALEALSTGRIDALEGRVDRIDRMANGGIAAAMAMGGTMVVPDANVSMSFNIATYRGQQGFSGAIVGRVAPKVYINAGVAGSTVKKSTGGRVGVTFGW